MTIDFGQFGGGTAVTASQTPPGSNIWTASYTLVAGAIDTAGRNVSVTATSGNGLSATAAGATGAIADTLLPDVTGVYVGSTAWNSSFLGYLTANNLGNSFGYAVPGGASQSTVLPWNNLNEISIRFNKPVIVQLADLALTGVNTLNYTPSAFNYDATTNTATWTLPAAAAVDKFRINLPSTVGDTEGNSLDGYWNDTVSAFPSGNGADGGAFSFAFNVLPGDADRNGSVQLDDFQIVRARCSPSRATAPTPPITISTATGSSSRTIFSLSAANCPANFRRATRPSRHRWPQIVRRRSLLPASKSIRP